MEKRPFDIREPHVVCGLWIALCFGLTSAAYLSWVYHLVPLAGSAVTDWFSMVLGYVLQAAGIALMAALLRQKKDLGGFWAFGRAVAVFGVVTVPALLSGVPAGALCFGLMMNLLCGVIAGFYLYALAVGVGEGHRGIAFGGGYGLGTIGVGLLSLVGSGSFLNNRWVLLVYAALGALSMWMAGRLPLSEGQESSGGAREPLSRGEIVLAAGVVALLSLVKNMGFSFPSVDIASGLRPELSRIFYAVGLAAAGFINDRDRRTGAVCTGAALAIPFIMLAMDGEPVPSFICWSLNYLFYGFFSVFRVVLFMDIAARQRDWSLALLGLLAGRMGDAAGTGLSLVLSDGRVLLIALTAGLFFFTVLLFFRMFRRLYEPGEVRQRSEREVFEAFSQQHDLSAREREVLRQLLSERSNREIAEVLFVSESTVKYHVHNLLKKTGCKSRGDLLARYTAALFPQMQRVAPQETLPAEEGG